MTTWIFVLCILAPGRYCADVVKEPTASRAHCEQLVQQYSRDRRVIVACIPEQRVQ